MATIKVGPTTLKVLQLVAEGKCRREIAAELGIRPDTVRDHIKDLRDRGMIVGKKTDMGYEKPTIKVDIKKVETFDPWNGTVAVME